MFKQSQYAQPIYKHTIYYGLRASKKSCIVLQNSRNDNHDDKVDIHGNGHTTGP